MQIAKLLQEEKVLNPTAYKKREDIKTPSTETADPYHWNTNTVVHILERREHTGCTVNFKTYTNSIWDKKQRETPIEKHAVFYNTHPAIIEQEVFDKVQEIRQQRHRRTKTGKSSLFSGRVYCSDCGAKMRYCTTNYYHPKSQKSRFVQCFQWLCNHSEKLGNLVENRITLENTAFYQLMPENSDCRHCSCQALSLCKKARRKLKCMSLRLAFARTSCTPMTHCVPMG